MRDILLLNLLDAIIDALKEPDAIIDHDIDGDFIVEKIKKRLAALNDADLIQCTREFEVITGLKQEGFVLPKNHKIMEDFFFSVIALIVAPLFERTIHEYNPLTPSEYRYAFSMIKEKIFREGTWFLNF